MPKASHPPPAGTPGPEASSWRPLFLPPSLDKKARSGPTRTSELPPPIEDTVPRIPDARVPVLDPGPTLRVRWIVGLCLTLFVVSALLTVLRH
jgi:hypothetical protein